MFVVPDLLLFPHRSIVPYSEVSMSLFLRKSDQLAFALGKSELLIFVCGYAEVSEIRPSGMRLRGMRKASLRLAIFMISMIVVV